MQTWPAKSHVSCKFFRPRSGQPFVATPAATASDVFKKTSIAHFVNTLSKSQASIIKSVKIGTLYSQVHPTKGRLNGLK